ncbi:hypothetical protein [Providencia rustigianii]|uniref:hypothetical protein n=1 Tax=Providencia rustigianii TaxID=158850 RepID=UPI00223FA3E2|nr:hypothetical protein [Providencia rustigianii]
MILELFLNGESVAKYDGGSSHAFLSSAFGAMDLIEKERIALNDEVYKKAIESLNNKFIKTAPTDRMREDPES